jgi:transcriptional regulator with XRE-family HTH domain
MNNPANGMKHIEIIEKIKSIRLEKGYSLGQLSKLTGLSKGYLSKIENAVSAPPISTLHRIATALGVNLSYFFTQNALEKLDEKMVISRKKQRNQTEAEVQATGLKRWPLADQKFGRNMQPYIIEIPPDHYQVYQFEGEEFYLCLEGKIEFTYGGENYILEAGDSVYIDTNIPYGGRSIDKEPAKILMVTYHYKRMMRETFSVGLLPYKKLNKHNP